MARQWRIQYRGAGYHVMARGIDGRKIFRDDSDFARFLELMGDVCGRFQLELYAFALLDNHVHVVLRTREANLSRAMQWILSTYASEFNRKWRRRGHLFQSRFKAIVVESNSYLRTLSAYVHWNPVRARIVRRPGEYRWSSYRDYVRRHKRYPWLRRELVLGEFGRTLEQRGKRYRKWLYGVQGHEMDFLEELRYGMVLGGDRFAEWLRAKFGFGPEDEVPQKRLARTEGLVDRVLNETAKKFGVPREKLTRDHSRRSKKLARDGAIYLLWKRSGVRNAELAEVFGIGVGAVTHAGRRMEARMAKAPELRRKMEAIAKRTTASPVVTR